MVTNLPAEARAKWLKVMEAKTPEEKLKALEEFLSAIPKHKGTENLVYQIRRQMAVLREEIELRKRKKAGGGGPKFFIEKEGAAQIVMLGLPNSGKSSLLAKLTNAKPVIADYPYTTREPVPGTLVFEDVRFQLVEAPAIIPDPSSPWENRVLGLARNADGLIIVIDLSSNPIAQLKAILSELHRANIRIVKPKGRVVIERTRGGGIRVVSMGAARGFTPDDVRKLLESYRIYNAVVKIYGEVTLDDVEKALFENVLYKPTVIIGNKVDLPGARERFKALEKAVRGRVPVIAASAKTSEGLEGLGKLFFDMLELVRVYTKQPNEDKPSSEPLILRKGATVLDVAKKIHSKLYEGFKYARIWGPSAKYPGERVGGDHVVADGDIVEIHSKY